MGGRHDSEGRLEVLHDGVWGTVCDDNFGEADATAICGILGLPLGVLNSAVGRPGIGRIWLDDVSFKNVHKSHITILGTSSLDWQLYQVLKA